MNFLHFGSCSSPVPDFFYFLWEVFLIDFLSKTEFHIGSLKRLWSDFKVMVLFCWSFEVESSFELTKI